MWLKIIQIMPLLSSNASNCYPPHGVKAKIFTKPYMTLIASTSPTAALIWFLWVSPSVTAFHSPWPPCSMLSVLCFRACTFASLPIKHCHSQILCFSFHIEKRLLILSAGSYSITNYPKTCWLKSPSIYYYSSQFCWLAGYQLVQDTHLQVGWLLL